jgi:hypothetical protein
VMFGFYIVSSPLIALLVQFMPDYSRKGFIARSEWIIMFVSQMVLVLLYNPNSTLNKSFPFHKETADMKDSNMQLPYILAQAAKPDMSMPLGSKAAKGKL